MDRGSDWVVKPGTGPMVGVVAVPQGVAYVASGGQLAYRTRDFGKTWRKIVAGIAKDAFVRVVRQDGNYTDSDPRRVIVANRRPVESPTPAVTQAPTEAPPEMPRT